MANKKQRPWLGSRQGSRRSSSIQAKTRCVLLSSQHPSKEEKPRRNRTLQQRRAKAGRTGPRSWNFFWLHSSAKPGRLGWPILALRCDQGAGDTESPRKGQDGDQGTPPHTLAVGWVDGNNLRLAQGQECRCQDGGLGWPAKLREPDHVGTQRHFPAQDFRFAMLKGETGEAWITQQHL